jgi:hypothetical protein
MGPSNSHLKPAGDSPQLFGGLPVNVQLVPHHMHAHNPTVRVELEERTNLDLSRRTMTRPWGRCRQGGSARGMTDERKHFWQLSGLGAETRATNSSKLQTLANLSLHSSLFEAPPRAIQIRHDHRRQMYW